MQTKREVLQSILDAARAQKASNLDVIAKVEFEMTREAAWLDEKVTDMLVFTASVLHPGATDQVAAEASVAQVSEADAQETAQGAGEPEAEAQAGDTAGDVGADAAAAQADNTTESEGGGENQAPE